MAVAGNVVVTTTFGWLFLRELLGAVSQQSPESYWAATRLLARRNEEIMTKDSIDRFIARTGDPGRISPGLKPRSTRPRCAAPQLGNLAGTAAGGGACGHTVPSEQATGWRETVHYLIAGLFALHPCPRDHDAERPRSLGVALHEAAISDSPQGPRASPASLAWLQERGSARSPSPRGFVLAGQRSPY